MSVCVLGADESGWGVGAVLVLVASIVLFFALCLFVIAALIFYRQQRQGRDLEIQIRGDLMTPQQDNRHD